MRSLWKRLPKTSLNQAIQHITNAADCIDRGLNHSDTGPVDPMWFLGEELKKAQEELTLAIRRLQD